MKRISAIILALGLTVCLAACGEKDPAPTATPDPKPTQAVTTPAPEGTPAPDLPAPEVTEGSKYTFVYGKYKLPMNNDFTQLRAALGEPEKYFEATSCAFDGLDKTFTYPGFELTTYPLNGVDYISEIYLTGDSTTAEGIGIGSTLAEMESAYGTDYTESFGQYTYTDGDTSVSFIVEDGKVISVDYLALQDLLG